MAWRTRLICPEERQKLEGFVSHHPKGHILQSYAWGEVKAGTGWIPLRLVVEEGEKILASLSILERRLPFLPRVIFYAPRGPVVDLNNTALLDFLLEGAKELARQRRAILLKMDPDVPPGQGLEKYFQKAGFRSALKGEGFEGVQPRFVFRLDITPTEEELLASLNPKTRYNLRLAEKKGVEVGPARGREDLRPFYDLLLETARRDHFLIRSFSYFETLWEELVEKDLAQLFLAFYQGEMVAGTLAFIMGQKAWYIYGASGNRHRNVMPNYLLQWRMILWAKSLGCTLYDFRGVPGNLDPANHLYGLYRFKKGFNGVYTEFIGDYDQVYSPFFYWIWQKGEPYLSGVVRRILRPGSGQRTDSAGEGE